MKQKQLIIFLSAILVIIAAITFIALKSIIGNKTPDNTYVELPENDNSTEDNPEDTPSNQDSTDVDSDESTETKPDENTVTEPADNTDVKPDVKPDESTDAKPADNTVSTPTSNSSGNESSSSQPAESVAEVDNRVYNTSMPNSYKDFVLTKDMSAGEAYEYLNGFLNSKYSILINKEHKVGSDYEPSDLTVPGGCQYKMESTAAKALSDMLSAARADGYSDLILYSGYRTYSSQKNKYETRTNKYLNQGYSQAQAEEKAGEYIAPPGSSEHHTGLAADVCSSKIVSRFGYLDDSFDTTSEFEWLRDHCSEYGFIMRYRKDAQSITGFLYEPWHYRYIGVDHAKACTALGVTYEEYHALLEKLMDEAKTEAGV